jgi:hypothetical protein
MIIERFFLQGRASKLKNFSLMRFEKENVKKVAVGGKINELKIHNFLAITFKRLMMVKSFTRSSERRERKKSISALALQLN